MGFFRLISARFFQAFQMQSVISRKGVDLKLGRLQLQNMERTSSGRRTEFMLSFGLSFGTRIEIAVLIQSIISALSL